MLGEVWNPRFSVSNLMPILSVFCQLSELRGPIIRVTGSQKGAPEFNWKPFVSSSTIPPDHTKALYMCLQGEKKNPFLIIILVASCNGGSVKAPLCTKGNRRPKKATVTCYGCRHIVRFSSPVCWAPWESLFHGNAFRNFSCALSSREDLNHVCNSMSNLKRSSECQDDLRSLPFYKRNKYIADGHGHFWLYIRTTF